MAVSIFPGQTTRQQDFTSSGTWTAPSGVYSAKFLVVGAGGGGGGTTQLVTEYAMGGGAGGGAVKQIDLSVTPGTSYTITIGAKGTGGSGAAAGGSGGFSEVLNGATSLIKCFGGAGGASTTGAGAEVNPTATQTMGGGGGRPNSGAINRYSGGGGGAFFIVQSQVSATVTLTSGEGSPGRTNASGDNGAIIATGGAGINGYGAGGGGAGNYSSGIAASCQGGSQFAGNGGLRTTAGVTNGGAAVANTGCGGGGGGAFLNATATTGGNGSDGLVRVVYFA